ncbi:MAG TPA: hypothetical protein VGK54_09245 [Chloroflexota bacterium]
MSRAAHVQPRDGAYRHFLPGVVGLAERYGDDVTDRVLETGDLRETQPPGSGQHICRMFRSREINDLVVAAVGACSVAPQATGPRSATQTRWPDWLIIQPAGSGSCAAK